MAKRTKKEYEMDCKRINEVLNHEKGRQITSKDRYMAAFYSYMEDVNEVFAEICFPYYAEKFVIPAAEEKIKAKEGRVAREAIRQRQIIKRKEKLDTPARIKGKIVYTEITALYIRGKSVIRYRDIKGRFASVKIKEYKYTPYVKEYEEYKIKKEKLP